MGAVTTVVAPAVAASGASVRHLSTGCSIAELGSVLIPSPGSGVPVALGVGPLVTMPFRVAGTVSVAGAGSPSVLCASVLFRGLPVVVALTIAGSATVVGTACRSALTVVDSVSSSSRISVSVATVVVVIRVAG